MFENTFKHRKEFYDLASKISNQVHFHTREFLKLKELYSLEDLDIILVHCIDNNIFKIENIKTTIKKKYFELIMEYEKTVLFSNAIELVGNLHNAIMLGTLKQKFSRLSKIGLLIIDDISYLRMDKEKESIFFQLIRQRYEKNSLILTTNL